MRDYLPPPGMAPGHVPGTMAEADAQLPPAESALVKSLLLRACYGGMQGDVAMLRGYAGYWAGRFAGQGEPPPPLPPPAAAVGAAGAAARGGGQQQQAAQQPSQQPTSQQRQQQPTSQQQQQQQQPASQQPPGPATQPGGSSAFLAYIRHLYNSFPGGAACSLLQLGPLQPDDLPLTAVDFHVSGVLQQVAADPGVQAVAAQLTAASWGAEGDAGECMRKAMWVAGPCWRLRCCKSALALALRCPGGCAAVGAFVCWLGAAADTGRRQPTPPATPTAGGSSAAAPTARPGCWAPTLPGRPCPPSGSGCWRTSSATRRTGSGWRRCGRPCAARRRRSSAASSPSGCTELAGRCS